MKILIAEDDRVSRRVLERHLEKWGHEVLSAADGEQAWQLLQTETDVPLLITDWMMPEMDGLQLCRLARSLQRCQYLHIIMLTGKGEKSDLLQGMKAGADVFLSKPFDLPELQAYLRVTQRTIDLETQLAQRLEEVTAAHQRMKADLEAAARTQKALLPCDPVLVPGVEFASVFDACDEVGGDMFNVFRLDEQQVGLYVLDVSGHGVEAALLSVSLSRSLMPTEGLLKHILKRPPYYEIVPPIQVAEELNRKFPVHAQTHQFFTFLYGILDVSTLTFTFTRAGHPGLVHLSRDAARLYETAGGIAIGIVEEATFGQESITLSPGDQIILYSDGVLEARNPEGEEFGTERMLHVLGAHYQDGITAAVQALRTRVREFTQEQPQHDDLTIAGLGLV